MKIEKIDIRYFRKDAFDAADMDGVRHVRYCRGFPLCRRKREAMMLRLGISLQSPPAAAAFYCTFRYAANNRASCRSCKRTHVLPLDLFGCADQ